MTVQLNGRWDASKFFEHLCDTNRLARQEGFTFCRVSGLDGFEEAVNEAQTQTAFVCVSDIADGYTELNNTPRTRRIKTVFFAMRHAAEYLDTATRRTWQRAKTAVKRTLNRILEKAGLTARVGLTDRDLSYLLWRQYRSRRKAGALEAAENQTRLEALRRDPESFAPEQTYGHEKTPVAGQPNRANEKLTSGSVLLRAMGDSSSNANVPSEV